MNENLARVVETLRTMQPQERGKSVESTPEYQKFVSAFPADTIIDLTLDQYCVGKGGQSFSWWLERGLQAVLGRYMPGTSRGHLLYWLKDGTVYKHRHLADLPDEDALRYTLAIQQVVAKAARQDDQALLDDDEYLYEKAGLHERRVTIAPGRKLRLLSAYNPDGVVPVNSVDHLRYFLQAFGLPESEMPPQSAAVAMSKILYRFFEQAKGEVPDVTPRAFMQALYSQSSELNPPKRKEGAAKAVDEESAEVEEKIGEEEYVGDAQQIDLDLNVILYGPPGTGKTYATVEEALRILDPKLLQFHLANDAKTHDDRESRRKALKERFDELQSEGRVAFVTFHQSFSYEDFVEGIRAETKDGAVTYRVDDGVFKRLCLDADVTVQKADPDTFELGDRSVWKMSLGNTLGDEGHIFDECVANGYVLLGYGEQIDFGGANSQDAVRERFEAADSSQSQRSFAVQVVHRFINELKNDDLIVVSEGNRRVRAIGVVTGDYEHAPRRDTVGFAQKRAVKWLRVYQPSLPASAIVNGNLSQQTLYALNAPTLNREKLAAILLTGTSVAPTALFSPGQRVGDTDYVVEQVAPHVVIVQKPNGSEVAFAWNMLLELATHVHQGRLSLQDIADKRVFEKVPGSRLEKFIVNGYNNVLWKVIQPIVKALSMDRPSIDPPRVLIIDEINRGNVSRIFGELISLIEPSKRKGAPEQLTATLPYSKEPFAIPRNVYILGTMNSADRSLTGLDVALRRRFRFKEILPNPTLLNELVISKINVGELLQVMNRRIELLLGRDFCLGHAYFYPLLQLGDASLQDLAGVFRHQILPLLEEYFFDDWERIRWVLNDHRSPEGQGFFRRPGDSAHDLLGAQVGATIRDNRWEHNPEALESAKSYLNVIAKQGAA